MVIFWFSPRSCGRWSRFYIQMFFQPGFTKNFRYLKWGYWTLYGYFAPFWEWVFPYISLASSLYSFSYLHFRYQRNVNGDGLKSNHQQHQLAKPSNSPSFVPAWISDGGCRVWSAVNRIAPCTATAPRTSALYGKRADERFGKKTPWLVVDGVCLGYVILPCYIGIIIN